MFGHDALSRTSRPSPSPVFWRANADRNAPGGSLFPGLARGGLAQALSDHGPEGLMFVVGQLVEALAERLRELFFKFSDRGYAVSFPSAPSSNPIEDEKQ
ncbi:MAG: hypothetical protein ACR652_22970 [Methylocystis sp.]|uniref:hypothetical protein n=1 Tax=Methylocystis sp. TaxID=1911079 RepID=UPI003DA2F679